jgi:hypothetical protein
MIIYTDPDGNDFYAMPKIWNNASPISWDYLEAYGWTRREEPDPEPVPVVQRYSTYKIKRKLEDMGLWADVKAAIEAAGFWDSFVLIQDIAADNEELQRALPLLHEEFPDVDIQELLAECVAD